MAQFVDVLLRGLLSVFAGIAAGGVAWAWLVLRASAHAKPDEPTRLALRATALAAGLAAAAQTAVGALVLGDVAGHTDSVPLASFVGTGFARAALARVVLASIVAVAAARLATRPGGRMAWTGLAAAALALVGSAASLSHAAARVADRPWLVALDAVHQLAVAAWVGGLAHFTLYAIRARREPDPRDGVVARRFSAVALISVAVLVASGIALSVKYVGELAAMVGTAYGVMILSKVVLLLAILGVAAVNYRIVRMGASRSGSAGRVGRLVEVELGLAVTVMFAAASLTSLPPAVDVRADRATPAEVGARFVPAPPRLTSPPVADLLRTADPLMAATGRRLDVERAWSEYNHHWAGVFVLTMGLLASLERRGVRAARHWPLVFLGLAAFLFARNDPRAWPLGPAGFWESMTLPDVLQHRAFVLLIVAFGIFEWAVRTGRLAPRPWSFVFPLLGAVGGGLLLTHSHAMFNLKDEFLTEVTHAPLGVLGAFMSWARWAELRLPDAGAAAGWIWRVCLIAVGLLLLVYREG
ncbi:MAG TPA: CopD family protein [Candidatus Acidoferrum sp.]|nr:CopD family protein [Candidatus Acidoferrum sp.]